MKSIAFIACSKTKRSVPCKARDMYQGALFKKSLQYCLQNYDEVYILSAKYGLLQLDDIIAPYEFTLNQVSRKEKIQWGIRIQSQLKKHNIMGDFWIYAGKNYYEFLDGDVPLRGLPIGKQLQWFNRNISKEGGFEL